MVGYIFQYKKCGLVFIYQAAALSGRGLCYFKQTLQYTGKKSALQEQNKLIN